MEDFNHKQPGVIRKRLMDHFNWNKLYFYVKSYSTYFIVRQHRPYWPLCNK